MKHFVLASSVVAALAGSADAAISTFTRLATWQDAPGNPGGSVFAPGTVAEFATEDFSGSAGPIGPSLSGGTGWSSWIATSSTSGGGLAGTGGALYSMPAGSSLVFTFGTPSGPSAGVMGVGGDFRFFSSDGSAIDGRIWVRLGNGSSVMRTFTAAEPFVGFWSNDLGAPIQSLRIQPISSLGPTTYVGIDTLYLATVPAPGSLAVLVAVGMIGSRRRR